MKKTLLVTGFALLSIVAISQTKKKKVDNQSAKKVEQVLSNSSKLYKVEATAEQWNQILTIISKTDISYKDYMSIQNFVATQINTQVDTTKH